MSARAPGVFKRILANRVLHFASIGLVCFGVPFVLVTRGLQASLRAFSHLTLPFFGFDIPFIPVVEVLMAALVLLYVRDKITKRRVYACLVMFAVFLFSWFVTDVYLYLSLYDIQANYHYAAYGLMTVLFFRAFYREDRAQHKLIYAAFATCMLISLADEGAQRVASHRVFDLNDNAKDALGVVMGLIVVHFIMTKYGTADLKSIPKGEKRIGEYVKNPASAIVILGIFTLIFLTVSALFSDPSYWYVTVLCTFLLFAVAMALLYATRFKMGRRALSTVIVILVLAQVVSVFVYWDDGIVFHSSCVTVYRGVPVPFCDVLVYPNGMVRPADKHHIFNSEIMGFFANYAPSIIVVGSNRHGDPNADVNVDAKYGSYLAYSSQLRRNIQVVTTSPEEACALYNQYRQEGKNVMLALHATCGGFFY